MTLICGQLAVDEDECQVRHTHFSAKNLCWANKDEYKYSN